MTTSEAAAEAAASARRRFVLPEFLSPRECKELEFIHRSCGVFGYRPFVLSTTLSHLVATNCGDLIIPILPVRENFSAGAFSRRLDQCNPCAGKRVKEAVEEYFGREYELFVEFTGLISWTKGANIGWHSDDNRTYLCQRHYSAVCYLNTYEEDFKGGLFHFQDGEPSTIIPSLGTLIIYTADERNMHCVDEVTEGERCTLALWFSSDRVHDEDQKLIQQISTAVPDLQVHPSDEELEKVFGVSPPKQKIHRPLAASSVMYKAHNLQKEPNQVVEGNTVGEWANPYFNINSDLRVVRLALMGLSCCFSTPAVDDQHDNPVMLTYKHKDVPHLFSSSLEALQVAEFHQFKRAMLKKCSSDFRGQCLANPLWNSLAFDADSSHSQIKADNSLTQTKAPTSWHGNIVHISNQELVSMECLGDGNEFLESRLKADHAELNDFLDSVKQFEAYTSNLWRKLFQFFPSWRTTGSLVVSDL